MFDKISEKRFQHLASDFVKLRDKVTETPGEVRNLRATVNLMEAGFNDYIAKTDRKINNLVEVIKALAKPADLKKVIAVGDDDTEITVEDVLDTNGLVPECEKEDLVFNEESVNEAMEEEREDVSGEYPRARYMEEGAEPTRAEPSNDEAESNTSTTSNYY